MQNAGGIQGVVCSCVVWGLGGREMPLPRMHQHAVQITALHVSQSKATTGCMVYSVGQDAVHLH